MKSLNIIIFLLFAELAVSAQNYGPVPINIKKISDNFSRHSDEKIFVSTDKTRYKPGETVWFRAFVTDGNLLPITNQGIELFVKLYDSNGKPDIQQLFRLNNGSAQGDLILPADLAKGNHFLCVYTSSSIHNEEISITVLTIDQESHNQWIAETRLKDSISTGGQKNEAYIVLREISGEICKNTNLRFQLLNGTEIIEKGKLKTDVKGELTIPFMLPAKTNGAPFILELSDSRTGWKSEKFLPSDLDSIIIRFYPEGGTLIPLIPSKIGFTALNKWGIPVDIEGSLQNQEGRSIESIHTFTRGLGIFSSENAANQKCRLVLSGKTGKNQSFDLPAPDPEGVALSVAKIDTAYISCVPNFGSGQKNSIILSINQGSKMYWASEMEIERNSRIKVPTNNLPHGFNQLSLFSEDGDLLAARYLFIDKKQDLKITVNPEKNKLKTGESMKIKVLLTNENHQPLAGNMTISVTDQYRLGTTRPLINEHILQGFELGIPISFISGGNSAATGNTNLLDFFLNANYMKGSGWTKIIRSKAEGNQEGQNALREDQNKNSDLLISDYIKNNALKYNLLYKADLPNPTYFANNKDLFQKAPKVFKGNSIALDSQRKMLESASSILDVIKTIKPYSIKNNMIVFVGSENSLNYQGGALLILDGQQLGTDISALSGISPLDVDHINVSTNAMDIQRYTGLNSVGIIEIFLKRGSSGNDITVTESVEKYDHGFRLPNKFPVDQAYSKSSTVTTLLWIPEQQVDQSGQFEFSVTAGKVLSDFVIEVQGISSNGQAGSGKATFSVVK